MPFTALPIGVALHAKRDASVVMVIPDDTVPSRTPAVKFTVSLHGRREPLHALV